MHSTSLMARLAGALAGAMAPVDLSTIGAANALAPMGAITQWPGLGHRGQPAARGILGLPVDLMSLGKNPGRRDKNRTRVRLANPGTRPDFSAQVAQEAKAARSRKARATRVY